jgi:GntP family gluconate:H+ symporter
MGVSHEAALLLDTLIAIIGLIFLITNLKVHPFVALMLAAGFIGLAARLALPDLVGSFQKGFGDVLGFVGIVIGLGTMLGKLMAVSGGADRIARTLVGAFGERRIHWAMMVVAFLVGIPLFFEVGFVLLIPLIFTVAKRVNVPLLKIGIPLMAGLSVVHGLVPPHPAPLLAIDAFGADIGKTIFYALIVGFPTAVIAGPLFGSFISKYVDTRPSQELVDQLSRGYMGIRDVEEPANPDESDTEAAAGSRVTQTAVKEPIPSLQADTADMPGFGVTLFTILLPVALMLLRSLADITLAKESLFRQWMDFIGNPIVALLAALLVAFYTFGFARGFNNQQILTFANESLAPIASIILIIGAGGGFKQMLIDTGVGDAIGNLAIRSNISPLLLGWLVAGLIRVATGSATVATITGAGIVAPIVAKVPGVNRELLVLATGAGSLILSHVNDAGFWLVKEYFNMTVPQTLKSWTVMETIISVVALIFILIINAIV